MLVGSVIGYAARLPPCASRRVDEGPIKSSWMKTPSLFTGEREGAAVPSVSRAARRDAERLGSYSGSGQRARSCHLMPRRGCKMRSGSQVSGGDVPSRESILVDVADAARRRPIEEAQPGRSSDGDLCSPFDASQESPDPGTGVPSRSRVRDSTTATLALAGVPRSGAAWPPLSMHQKVHTVPRNGSQGGRKQPGRAASKALMLAKPRRAEFGQRRRRLEGLCPPEIGRGCTLDPFRWNARRVGKRIHRGGCQTVVKVPEQDMKGLIYQRMSHYRTTLDPVFTMPLAPS